MKFFIIILGLVGISSCRQKPVAGWIQKDKDDFMNNCVPKSHNQAGLSNEKSQSYCSCMLQKLEAKYKTADEANKGTTQLEMTGMAKECLK